MAFKPRAQVVVVALQQAPLFAEE